MGFATAMLFVMPLGCALLGVEPDEIDVLTGETGEGETEGGGPASTSTGDDAPGGDGDGDPGGDGDGDPNGTGDGDGEVPGDGDGDTDSTGDTGTETGEPCQLEAIELEFGLTPIELAAAPSNFASECGGEGPEQVYRIISDADMDISLALIDTDFTAGLVHVESCEPIVELECVTTPDPLILSLSANEPVFILVDALDPNGGAGTLELLAI